MESSLCHYQKIGDDIRALVTSGKLLPGDKAPSVADLRRRYDISHITALRALRELSHAGLVRNVKGKGYFISAEEDATPVRKGSVANLLRVLRPTTLHDNYFNEINQGAQAAVLSRRLMLVHAPCCAYFDEHYPSPDALRDFASTMLRLAGEVDGFLVDERVPDSVLEELLGKIRKPMVLVNRLSKLHVDTVTPDNRGWAQETVPLLLRMGYERFVVCKGTAFSGNTVERVDAFVDALGENGVSPAAMAFVSGAYDDPWESTTRSLRNAIGKPSRGKVLIFAPTDNLARSICDIAEELGIHPGKDTGVLGFEGMGYARLRPPKLATIEINAASIGAKAVAVLMGRIDGTLVEKPSNHTVEGAFNIGETL